MQFFCVRLLPLWLSPAAIMFGISDPVMWIGNNMGIFYLSIVFSFVSLITLLCVRHSYPANFIVLAVFTVSEAFLIGVVCALSDTAAVLQAVVTTAVVFTALTIHAWTTSTDYSVFHGIAISCLFALIVLSFFASFVGSSSMDFLISLGGVLLFSAFIVIDTQLIAKKYNVDEYILGAIELYLDILNLFLYLLQLFNR
ncbi:hypothetical protein GEMRC1_007221 [Eukaryota sp. GEM-RC1]